MNIKFEKDGAVKETHPKFTDDLIAVGWSVVDAAKPVEEKSERDLLKEEADELGITYPKNIKNDKLIGLIEGARDNS